jgi:hypothetical protein
MASSSISVVVLEPQCNLAHVQASWSEIRLKKLARHTWKVSPVNKEKGNQQWAKPGERGGQVGKVPVEKQDGG